MSCVNKHNSLTKLILLALEKSVDGYVRLEDFIYNSHIYAGGYDRPLKKASLAQALARVRKNGWVELIDNQSITLKLTDKGRRQVLLASLETSTEEWDGKWRMVIFDIPEKRRMIRSKLRKNLRIWGFEPWQKSVWAINRNCTKQLREYINDLGIKEWVLILETDNVDF